jgi:hypothetical protein
VAARGAWRHVAELWRDAAERDWSAAAVREQVILRRSTMAKSTRDATVPLTNR